MLEKERHSYIDTYSLTKDLLNSVEAMKHSAELENAVPILTGMVDEKRMNVCYDQFSRFWPLAS